jgi:hypothetical protein
MEENEIKQEMLELVSYLKVIDFVLYKNVMLISEDKKETIKEIERKLKFRDYKYNIYKNKKGTKYCIDIKLKNERDDYIV